MTTRVDGERGAALLLTSLVLLSSLAVSVTASTLIARADLRAVRGATAAADADSNAAAALSSAALELATRLRKPSEVLPWRPCRSSRSGSELPPPAGCRPGRDWLPGSELSSQLHAALGLPTTRVSLFRLSSSDDRERNAVGGEYLLQSEAQDRSALSGEGAARRAQRARYGARSLLLKPPLTATLAADSDAVAELFGLSSATLGQLRYAARQSDNCDELDARAAFHWIDGDCDLSRQALLGDDSAPLLLWVNGVLTLAPGGRLNGLVISSHDEESGLILPPGARIDGAFVNTARLPSDADIAVNYRHDLLQDLQYRLLQVTRLPGSWADY